MNPDDQDWVPNGLNKTCSVWERRTPRATLSLIWSTKQDLKAVCMLRYYQVLFITGFQPRQWLSAKHYQLF